jgi:hypothetical protein
MASKPGIPVADLRRIPAEHLSPHDANVNGWPEREPDRQLLIPSTETSRMRHASSGGARGRRAGQLRRAPVPRLSAAAAGRT